MTQTQQVAESAYLARQYKSYVAAGTKPTEAARLVDREMIVRMLIRKLHREPTELEISREFARL